ncbi:MAG: hypothetical protein AAGF20_03260 [Pseudomonadota bacterium]
MLCHSITNETMLTWLRQQVRILEAWREEMAMRPCLDMSLAQKLERHYQWLTGEIGRLETETTPVLKLVS